LTERERAQAGGAAGKGRGRSRLPPRRLDPRILGS